MMMMMMLMTSRSSASSSSAKRKRASASSPGAAPEGHLVESKVFVYLAEAHRRLSEAQRNRDDAIWRSEHLGPPSYHSHCDTSNEHGDDGISFGRPDFHGRP